MSKHGNEGHRMGVNGRPGVRTAISVHRNKRSTRSDAMASMKEELRQIRNSLSLVLDHLVDGAASKSKYMTKEEVAEFLHESVRQVDRRRARGEIPQGVRIGRRRLFLRDQVEGLNLDELKRRAGE